MLRSLGVMVYSPPLHYAIASLREIASGHSWEVQLRGCSIWYEPRLLVESAVFHPNHRLLTPSRAVELIRREILAQHPEATNVNAVLIDFLLYDIAKEREAAGECISKLSYSTRASRVSVSSLAAVAVGYDGLAVRSGLATGGMSPFGDSTALTLTVVQ